MAISSQSSHADSLDSDFPSLKNHFLVAMPGLEDPFFKQSVTYIIQHDAEGAMGVMINQPMPIMEKDLLEQVGLSPSDSKSNRAVLSGGPVQIQRGFVLHRDPGKWESSLAITDRIALTTSMDILKAIAEEKGPEDYCLLLGYAGWDAGQLDKEMLDNAWLTVPAREDILFDVPMDQRWQQASQLLGIDIYQLSNVAGHC